MSASLDFDDVKRELKAVQEHITAWVVRETDGKEAPREDLWDYAKGSGGGATRVWECVDSIDAFLEKGGVNFSALEGQNMPTSATTALKIPENAGYKVSGVSLVFHPRNPHVPTIHMNVRYFEADTSDDLWWFGGGVDVTPVYPRLAQVKRFHEQCKAVCDAHGHSYDEFKEHCDRYFYLKHRKEARGVGGLFFDHLGPRKLGATADKRALLDFVVALGTSLTDMYAPFAANRHEAASTSISDARREFQLWRRSRYVEFNLLFDRGTKFGIESDGRTESILMSMPATCIWRYQYTVEPESAEARSLRFLQARNWLAGDIERELRD
jgi:coproporphyrinogen III oxidase